MPALGRKSLRWAGMKPAPYFGYRQLPGRSRYRKCGERYGPQARSCHDFANHMDFETVSDARPTGNLQWMGRVRLPRAAALAMTCLGTSAPTFGVTIHLPGGRLNSEPRRGDPTVAVGGTHGKAVPAQKDPERVPLIPPVIVTFGRPFQGR